VTSDEFSEGMEHSAKSRELQPFDRLRVKDRRSVSRKIQVVICMLCLENQPVQRKSLSR
jgi:hypothetical protein